MQLSLIINTYNRPAQVGRCLHHIAAMQAGDVIEVIVIDDGGDVDLAKVVAPFGQHLNLRLKRIQHAGYSAARNAGVRLAKARRIWFLGDDVMVTPHAWRLHMAVTDKLIALLGPYPMQSANGISLISGSPPFRKWCEVNPMDDVVDTRDAGYEHFVTGNLSMDRELFFELGGFDENYMAYGWEDIDLGIHFQDRGGRVMIEPAAAAVHEHPMQRRSELWERERLKGINARRFYEKWKARGPEYLNPVRIWPPDDRNFEPGPIWRFKLGQFLISLLDDLAPNSKLNKKLYERMIHACRARGFTEGLAPKYLHGIE